MKQIGVILSGCGVYDGSEIQETVFTLLAIAQNNAKAICFAPNINQHHVINHLNGDEMEETRNTLVEAARIARGEIKSLEKFNESDLDALVIPGGFGAAKNLTTWAFNGPDGEINHEVKKAILAMHTRNKPICGLCMAPTVIAKALEKTNAAIHVSVGTNKDKSPYDIAAISGGINATGAVAEMKTIHEICIDTKNKIITAPCYMMEASIVEVKNNIDEAISQLFKFIN
jgi:enhancing lycopene biosynthesis protein 2